MLIIAWGVELCSSMFVNLLRSYEIKSLRVLEIYGKFYVWTIYFCKERKKTWPIESFAFVIFVAQAV